MTLKCKIKEISELETEQDRLKYQDEINKKDLEESSDDGADQLSDDEF